MGSQGCTFKAPWKSTSPLELPVSKVQHRERSPGRDSELGLGTGDSRGDVGATAGTTRCGPQGPEPPSPALVPLALQDSSRDTPGKALMTRQPGGAPGGHCRASGHHGTFTVHLGQQLAQRLPHFPRAVDEHGHHLQQLLFVLLVDNGDCLQNQLHLLQLVAP